MFLIVSKLSGWEIPYWKWLFDGTVPSKKKLFDGTVPSNKKLYDGTPKKGREGGGELSRRCCWLLGWGRQ